MTPPAGRLGPVKAPALAATPLLAAVVWILALIADPGPFQPPQFAAIGVGLLTCSVVAMVGMVVPGGRWARRLAMASVAGTVPLALVRPIDVLWVVGLILSTAAASALFHPALTAGIRGLPAASGPPTRAVVLPLLLIAVPYLLGLAASEAEGWLVVLVASTAPLAAFAYSRVIPGGLWAVRIVWPVLALGTAPLLGWVTGTVSVSLATATVLLAWHPSVKTSYHPPREVGIAYPIPPELAPKEILDAAHIDERGKPRR